MSPAARRIRPGGKRASWLRISLNRYSARARSSAHSARRKIASPNSGEKRFRFFQFIPFRRPARGSKKSRARHLFPPRRQAQAKVRANPISLPKSPAPAPAPAGGRAATAGEPAAAAAAPVPIPAWPAAVSPRSSAALGGLPRSAAGNSLSVPADRVTSLRAAVTWLSSFSPAFSAGPSPQPPRDSSNRQSVEAIIRQNWPVLWRRRSTHFASSSRVELHAGRMGRAPV